SHPKYRCLWGRAARQFLEMRGGSPADPGEENIQKRRLPLRISRFDIQKRIQESIYHYPSGIQVDQKATPDSQRLWQSFARIGSHGRAVSYLKRYFGCGHSHSAEKIARSQKDWQQRQFFQEPHYFESRI